jgi:hypothetical protein
VLQATLQLHQQGFDTRAQRSRCCPGPHPELRLAPAGASGRALEPAARRRLLEAILDQRAEVTVRQVRLVILLGAHTGSGELQEQRGEARGQRLFLGIAQDGRFPGQERWCLPR